jgi:hypothetical protein
MRLHSQDFKPASLCSRKVSFMRNFLIIFVCSVLHGFIYCYASPTPFVCYVDSVAFVAGFCIMLSFNALLTLVLS